MGKAARIQAAVKAAQEGLAAKQAKPTVCVGYVHENAGRVSSFEDSLWALRDFDAENSQLIQRKLTVRKGTDSLPEARNRIAAQFVQAGDCEWLLMVDTDMGFPPDALYRLIEAAHPEHRPIVGGLCFTNRELGPDGMFGQRARPTPTIFDWKEDPNLGIPGFQAILMYPVNSMVRCAATGAAFLLVHRSAFERIAALEWPEGSGETVGPRWFDKVHDAAGKMLGEDISFCVRANLAKIPVFVHTGVRTTHFKPIWLQEQDHWRYYQPGPAVDEVAVIVPVLRRPQNAEPFMRSLRASTGLANVYAVADEDDPETAAAWEAAGARVINRNGNPRTFAKKVNIGYKATSEPWLFMVGDDVKFYPGWLDHAQHVAEILEADVVGTNGLGNQRELDGTHSGHLLIRRSYVDTVGASWDGPGVVCHESYRHNFVDDEVVTAAKVRGKWQMALGAIVEHQHPFFDDDVETDETYALGAASFEQDQALFRQRVAEHVGVKA